MQPRIQPATPPFEPEIESALQRVMGGRPPLLLFRVLARDPRLFKKFFAGGLLDRGHLTLRDREIVICRTTALCGAEYEWAVHVQAFAAKAGLTEQQIAAMAAGRIDRSIWSERDTVLLHFSEMLHARCDVDDALWARLREHFSEEAMIELLLLAGFYRTVSYLTNALRLPLEPQAAPSA